MDEIYKFCCRFPITHPQVRGVVYQLENPVWGELTGSEGRQKFTSLDGVDLREPFIVNGAPINIYISSGDNSILYERNGVAVIGTPKKNEHKLYSRM